MTVRPFGTAPSGEPVYLVELDNGRLSCQIITFGATIRSLVVPDRDGVPVDVVLGYDTLKGYLRNGGYLGATVGRYANRIAGGRFGLDGQIYELATNNGRNHLHGGRKGFSHRVWSITRLEDASVTLSLFSPDGEEGYPGDLICSVQFSLEADALSICYRATSTKDTVCSLTNHSYFNLAGQGSVLDQQIQLFADSYTPSDEGSIPFGTVEPVAGTPMDLRAPTPIGAHIREDFRQLRNAHGYDHNYVIDGTVGTLRPVAMAYAPTTGIVMEARTTLPGVHFYTGNFISPWCRGKGGCNYGPYHGFCLETQHFPDAPNQPQFPSALLKAGEVYAHSTLFRFATRPDG